MTTPTQRTLKALRDEGWLAAVVEHWNPHAKIRQDLFGFADIIAVMDRRYSPSMSIDASLRTATVVLVQACAAGDLARRTDKVLASENARICAKAGIAIEVWGWRKYAKPVNRKWWRPKVNEITWEDFK